MNIHKAIGQYIDVLIKTNNIYSLVISGPAGLGKTSCVLQTLTDQGFKEDENFIYIAGYITPLKLYEILSTSRVMDEPKILVFDDVDNLLANKTSLALLKSALSEAMGKRIITYESRSVDLRQFEFNGKIILITNNLSKNKTLQSLLDRGISYDFENDVGEMIKYTEENLNKFGPGLTDEERRSVFDKVKRFMDSPSFSFRAIKRAFAFYNANKEDWYQLFVQSIKRK